MADRSAGSASIRIRPDATKFIADLKRDLAAKNAEFVMQVSADTGQARADIDRFRQMQQRNGIRMGVDMALGQAQADMAAFRARQQADGLTIKVDADTDKAQRELRAVRSQLGDFGSLAGAVKINLGAGAIAGLPALASGLANVAAGLQQVAQAGLAVPGALAGAAASVGTLVLGLSGIKDAWDAASSAADSAGADQAAAARSSAAASNQLRNSLVDEARARDDVARATRDAKQQLQDLRIEQRGGMIDESRAILEAQKAREDLAKGNYSDIRDAALRVAEADQRVIEVRNRNVQTADRVNEANAKGVAGSDLVVDANERLVRSQQQVADAQAAVADSGSKVSSAQDKANKAMAELSPNAQQVVRTLLEMKPAFQDLRNSVSEPLLAGKADEFKNFFTAVTPNLKTGLGAIATGWNQNISALLGSLGSEQGKGLLDRILGNTADAQGRLSAAMQPLVEGIGTLTAAGTDALPRMADGITSVLERFRDFITEADKDGRLKGWIDSGLTGLRQLGESVLNIGKSFTAITQAATAGGGRSFLEWLQDATGRLQTFLNSTEGQNKLQEYFAQGRDIINELKPVLAELPGLFQGISNGASQYIGGMLPILRAVSDLLSGQPELVGAVVNAFIAWKTITGIASVFDSLTKVANLLDLLPGKAEKAATNSAGSFAGLSKVLLPLAAALALDDAANVTPDSFTPGKASNLEILLGKPGKWLNDAIHSSDPASSPATTAGGPGSLSGGVPQAQLNAPANSRDSGGVPTPAAIPGIPDAQAHAPANSRDSGGLPPGMVAVPTRAMGGPTPSGRGTGPTGGFLAEVHSDEWILPAHARRAVGDAALWKLTAGRSFEPGGYVDENGNPITPGAAPGPALIAPNPTGGPGGGLTGIVGSIQSGLQGPISMGSQLLGSLMPGGQQQPANPMQSFGSNLLGGLVPGLGSAGATGGGQTQLLPGLAGLFQAGGNPALQQQWLGQTGDWLANWGANTVLSFGKTLVGGVLNFFGAGDLMNNPIIQGIGQTVGHLANVGMQLAGPQPGTAPAGADLASILQGANLPPDILQSLLSGTAPGAATASVPGGPDWDAIAQKESSGNWQAPSDNSGGPYRGGLQILDSTWQQFGGTAYAPTADKASKSQQIEIAERILASQGPGAWPNTFTRTAAAAAPGSGSTAGNGGLQINTLRGKQLIQAAFPWASDIGGVRADPLKWHPQGLALDVMIPGAGGLNDPTPPQGKAMGDQLYAWIQQHKSELGVDYVLWQQKDHFNHLHVNFSPSGYPGKHAFGGAISGPGGPTSDLVPSLLSNGEHVLTASDVNAMGGQQAVYNFRQALHKFAVGGAVTLALPTPAPAPPRVPDARMIIPPAQPKIVQPAPRPAPRPVIQAPPTPAPPAPVAPQQPAPPAPQTGQSLGPIQAGVPQGIVAPPSGIDHTLPWINQAIMSTASTLGNIAATAASMGAGAAGAGPAGGLAGSMVSGLFQQGGKVATKVANVVSSALVGSVPGSFTDKPSGEIVRAEQRRPSTADYRGGDTYQVQGYEPVAIAREIQMHQSLKEQAALAAKPG